jgi:hypothetical protein
MGWFLLSVALAVTPSDGAGHDIPIAPDAPAAAPAAPAEIPPGAAPAPPQGTGAVPATGTPAAPATPADPTAPAATAPPTPAAAATAAPGDAGDTDVAPPERAHVRADSLYLKALDAWKDRRWSRAWRLAGEALRLEPDHAPARLLAGYALLKMHSVDAALVTLDGLSWQVEPDPKNAEIRQRAWVVRRRFLDPRQRDQVSLSVGNLVLLQRAGDTVTPLGGYVFAVQVPVVGPVAVRADGGNPWGGTANTLDVRGPRFDVLAVAEMKVDGGLWHVDLGAGPALWAARSGFWPDGWMPYVGVRGAVGTDVRLGRTLGLRFEVGASVFPAATTDLGWYAEPLDFRFGLSSWFGGPVHAPHHKRAAPVAATP